MLDFLMILALFVIFTLAILFAALLYRNSKKSKENVEILFNDAEDIIKEYNHSCSENFKTELSQSICQLYFSIAHLDSIVNKLKKHKKKFNSEQIFKLCDYQVKIIEMKKCLSKLEMLNRKNQAFYD